MSPPTPAPEPTGEQLEASRAAPRFYFCEAPRTNFDRLIEAEGPSQAAAKYALLYREHQGEGPGHVTVTSGVTGEKYEFRVHVERAYRATVRWVRS